MYGMHTEVCESEYCGEMKILRFEFDQNDVDLRYSELYNELSNSFCFHIHTEISNITTDDIVDNLKRNDFSIDQKSFTN